MRPVDIGDKVICTEPAWHCLCGAEGCSVHAGDVLTVSARTHFPFGPALQFEERRSHADGDNTPPWFVASAFRPRVN